MKQIKRNFHYLLMLFILFVTQFPVFGQDSAGSSSSSTTVTTSTSTTVQPWMWIIGAIVVLIIIIALARGGRSKDKVIVTKETIKE